MIKDKKRVAIFDILRGFMLINMVLYHIFYDMVYILGYSLPWYHSESAYLWQEIIACTFIAVSGACSVYSKNNFKRGAIVLLCAGAVTLTTSFLGSEYIVRFGILHCLGVSMILFPIIKPVLNRINPIAGLLSCTILYVIFTPIQDSYFEINLFPLGIRTAEFMSSDYFPLIPYFFVFIAGSFLGRMKMPEWAYSFHIPALEYLGRHSLIIYLIHQPIIYILIQGFLQ